jgi:hypothetical protein
MRVGTSFSYLLALESRKKNSLRRKPVVWLCHGWVSSELALLHVDENQIDPGQIYSIKAQALFIEDFFMWQGKARMPACGS